MIPTARQCAPTRAKQDVFGALAASEIAKRNDSLDISWLQDDSVRRDEDLSDPGDIADEILAQLSIATEEMQELSRLLNGTQHNEVAK